MFGSLFDKKIVHRKKITIQNNVFSTCLNAYSEKLPWSIFIKILFYRENIIL